MSLLWGAALLCATAACITDLHNSRIPNALTFTALIVAMGVHAFHPAGEGLAFSLAGAAVGLAVFFPGFALGGMGAGDVKLLAALGAWIGWKAILMTALYGAVAGGVLAVVVALWHGYLRQAASNIVELLKHFWWFGLKPMPALTLEHGRGPRLAYAVPIFVGLVVTLWRS